MRLHLRDFTLVKHCAFLEVRIHLAQTKYHGSFRLAGYARGFPFSRLLECETLPVVVVHFVEALLYEGIAVNDLRHVGVWIEIVRSASNFRSLLA